MAASIRYEHYARVDMHRFSLFVRYHTLDQLGAAIQLIAESAQHGHVPDLSDPGVADLWPCMTPKRRWLGRRCLSAAQRAEIFARDGAICRYCGDEDGPHHVDHVLAVTRGGTDDPDNLCIACEPCNLSKGAKLLSEWIR